MDKVRCDVVLCDILGFQLLEGQLSGLVRLVGRAVPGEQSLYLSNEAARVQLPARPSHCTNVMCSTRLNTIVQLNRGHCHLPVGRYA